VGLDRKGEEMNDEVKLGRVGHYSYQSVCQTALITYVHDENTVNVGGWNHAGDTFRRELVAFGHSEDLDTAEFHLNRECPWQR
jgi:hypothetical protein